MRFKIQVIKQKEMLEMIKTLLAGTILSTGLFAGGVLDTEGVKKDEKVEKTKYSETIEMPEGTDSNQMKSGKVQVAYKNEDGTFTVKEIDKSEIPTDGMKAEQGENQSKPMKATRHTDGTFTIQEINESEIPEDGVAAQPVEGEMEEAELDNSRPAPETPENQPTKVKRQQIVKSELDSSKPAPENPEDLPTKIEYQPVGK